MPEDDSRQFIPSIHIECVEVPKGEEGADIVIERIEAVAPDAPPSAPTTRGVYVLEL